MAVLDLRPPSLTIKFDKGKTLNPVFYYLGKDNSIIDLTGFDARMQARLKTDSDVLAGWDLDTANGGLVLTTGNFTTDEGDVIQDAHGVQLNVSDVVTAAITWETAVYDIELIDGSAVVLPFLKGDLQPFDEQTR